MWWRDAAAPFRLQSFSTLLLVFTVLSAAPSVAYSQQQPSSGPILRVETGMHTAQISRAAADAAGHLLATASADKTLRLWSLATGELLRTIRPPLGEGAEGMLYAVAMSPDGKTVAAGGWTGYQWEHSDSIYLFDAGSGRLVQRIAGLPNVIGHLAWSPDGGFIAASLYGNNGIRVFRVADGTEAARDTDYGDRSNGLAFDRSGRLASVALDGFVRLYDAGFRRIAEVRAPSSRRPYSVAFSSDAPQLAIGYDDRVAVDVLSASDLKPLFAADTTGVTDGDLMAVGWTSDGTLLAGGRHQGGLLMWPQGGKGARQTLPAADNSVLSIVTLPDGGFAYATHDPSFGRYDARGQRIIDHRAGIADYRNQRDKLRLSVDAATIAFGLEVFGRQPMSFSVADRRLAPGEALDDVAPADVRGLPIGDWENNDAPKLDGNVLRLKEYELSRSIAIAPDHRSLLLGADWNLRRFDAAGAEVWEKQVPGVAWAVNLSRDGRLAVAAFGDGTIRWYRYDNGKELLALFVHKDGKRWVLWTPEGYYDASPGAEDLIGWHVNRGLDHEADFFPASRFRDRFYKPEVVSAVLRTLDTEAALKQSGTKAAEPITRGALPPVIKILSPQEGTVVAGSPVQVRYSLRSPSGEHVTAIEIRVDGRPLPGGQGMVALASGPASPDAEQDGTLSVPIEKDATVTLVAKAGERTSEAANVRLGLRSSIVRPAPVEVPKPKLYVLSVGVSHYRDQTIKQLQYADKDASDVAAAWASQEGGLYGEVVTRILSDEKATRAAVLEGLDWLVRETTQHDVALVLLSGHGENDERNAYYFLPYDVDLEHLRATGVADIEIRKSLSQVAGKALFFFDTCHSGAVIKKRYKGININGFISELTSAENGLVVFAASTRDELAQESDEWKNGAFSKALVEGLSGQADIPRQGVITISLLEYWLGDRVKKLTNGEQHPTTYKPDTIRDFPIAIAGGH